MLGLAPLGALAEEAGSAAAFTIGDIRVQGLQRVSPGTVFGLLPVNVGDRYDEYLARETRHLVQIRASLIIRRCCELSK